MVSIDGPNRILIALALLFVVMGISIAVAVMFPYVDSHALELEAAALLAMNGSDGVNDAALFGDDYDGLGDSHSGATSTGDSSSSSISTNPENGVEKEIIDDGGSAEAVGADQSALEVSDAPCALVSPVAVL